MNSTRRGRAAAGTSALRALFSATTSSPAAGTSSLALANQPDGELLFRVRGLHDGQIGFYVTPASATQSILVDRRTLVDITNAVQTAMSNVTFANDCVATAPTPACAHGTTAPTARNLDCTATPRSPVAGSRATME